MAHFTGAPLSLREAARILGYNPDYIGYLIREGQIRGKKTHKNFSWRVNTQSVIEYCYERRRGVKNIDKKEVSLVEAAKISGYAPDYIGYLIRQGKIKGRKVPIQVSWLVSQKEVERYRKLKRRSAELSRIHKKTSGRKKVGQVPVFVIPQNTSKIFNISLRLALAAFIIFFFISEFAPAKFLQSTIGAVFFEETKIANFYTTLSYGEWQNPENVQGPPEVGPLANIDSFSEINSALYINGPLSLVAENFVSPDITTQDSTAETGKEETLTAESTTTVLNSGISLSKRIAFIRDSIFGNIRKFFGLKAQAQETTFSAKIKISFALGEKKPDISIIEQKENSTSSEEQTSFWNKIKNFLGSLVSRMSSIAKAQEGGQDATNSAMFETHSTSTNGLSTAPFINAPFPLEEATITEIPTPDNNDTEQSTTTQAIPAPDATSGGAEQEATTTEEITEVITESIGGTTTQELLVAEATTTTEATTTQATSTEEISEPPIIEETLPDIDTKIIILWSLDGQNWQVLDKISSHSLSNALNGGYFEYDALFLQSFEEVENLKIKFEGMVGGETKETVFVDSVWVEVAYKQQATSDQQQEQVSEEPTEPEEAVLEEMPVEEEILEEIIEETTEEITEETEEPPEEEVTEEEEIIEEEPEEEEEEEKEEEMREIKFLSEKDDFKSNEEPEFKFKYKKIKGVLSTFSGWQDINVIVRLKNPSGQIFDISPDFVFESDGNFSVKIKKLREFKPGLYTIILTIEDGEIVEELTQDFTWGVLAINTNKSIYVTPSAGSGQANEQAYIQMAALKEDGHTICDANLRLEISSSNEGIAYPLVQRSGECGPDNVTKVPDYFAYYQVGELGTYQIKLTNLNTGYKITDSFEVREFVPFDVERIGPTRIWPQALYGITLRIKANQDFVGEVIETVPKSFEVIATSDKRQETRSGEKLLIWDVDWKAGETHELSYQFDAPDISPYLYLLGPLKFTETGSLSALIFSEIRQWQIASDAPDDITKSPSANTVPAGGTGWAFPEQAYTSDDNVAHSDTAKGAVHIWYNYGFSLTGASITKVEVGLEAFGPNSSNYMTVACSWNGEASWTSEKSHFQPSTDPDVPTYIDLTDGRTWTPDELSNANFRVRVTEIDPQSPTALYIDWIPVRVTYSTPPTNLNQRSVVWQNDNGDSNGNPLTGGYVNQNSTSTSPDTSLTMEKGERATFRVQIDNTGAPTTTSYKLQWATTTGPGTCTSTLTFSDVGTSSAIAWSYGLSGTSSEALTSSKCATNSYTWTNGEWREAVATTSSHTLGFYYYTEFGFMIHTANAATGTTYCLLVINNNGGLPLNNYYKFGELTIVSSPTKKYSKNAVGAISDSDTTADLTYFLDNKGYSDVNTKDDGNLDPITSSSNIPVFLFAKKHVNSIDPIDIEWNGSTTQACSVNAVYLQVYNATTSQWETFASSTTCTASADFSLTTLIISNPENYYDSNYWRYIRVYQSSGTQTLTTDYIKILGAAPEVNQRSYLFENDDGSDVNSNSDMAASNTAATQIKKGQRLEARFQLDNTGGTAKTSAYKLQYDKDSDAKWTDVAWSGAPSSNVNANFKDWNTTQISYASDNVGFYSSIAIGINGYPVISHQNQSGGTPSLLVTKCNNLSCSDSTTTKITYGTEAQGSYSSIAIGTDGFPVISHRDTFGTSSLLVTKCNNLSCSNSTTTKITYGSDSVGSYSSIAIGTDGFPVIS
ncbi:hypothetical protein AMJ50_00130, partial [Parcubacteria bacterium DG_74_3]